MPRADEGQTVCGLPCMLFNLTLFLWQVHGTVVFSVCFQENMDNHCIFLFQQNVMNADPVGWWYHYGAFLIESADYIHLWWILIRGFLLALSWQELGVFMETEIHDEVLLAPSIMINIGTNVGPFKNPHDQYVNTGSFYTYQGTHHTNKRSTVRCQGRCANPAQPRWVAGFSRTRAVRIKNPCRKNWRT